MSHDDHGHDSGPPKPTNPFFIVGIILFMAFFALQPQRGRSTPSSPQRVPVPISTPRAPRSERVAEKGPTYNPNVVDTTGLIRPGDEIKKPQVGSFVTWGFSRNFLKGISLIPVIRETLDNSITYSTKNTLKVLNNKYEAERNMEATLRLTDKIIQDNHMKLIPDEMEFKDSANHVNCFTDEDGGSDHKPTGGQVSQSKSPGAAALTMSAMALHSTLSIGTLPMTGYNWFTTLPNQLVGLDNGLPCGTKDEGTHVATRDNGDAHEMEYDGDNLQWTATNYFSEEEISRVLSCLRAPRKIDPRTGELEEVDCGNLIKGFGAITEFSTLVPHAEDLFKWFGRGPKDEKEGFTYIHKPVGFNNPLEHGRFSQDIDLLLTVFSGTKTVSEAIYAWEAARRWDRDLFDCTLTPKEMQDPAKPCPTPEPEPSITPTETETCESSFFEKLKGGIEYSRQGSPANAGYSIDYRNAGAALTEGMKAKAIELMAPNMMNGGSKGIENIHTYWDMISLTAAKYKWNPVFVAALWIEESAAGGHPNASHDLGCLYGWEKANMQGAVSMPKVGQSNICDQMACLFSHPVKNPNDFSGFMCSYNSDDVSVGQYQCQASNGWTFPKNLKMIYDLLIGAQ